MREVELVPLRELAAARRNATSETFQFLGSDRRVTAAARLRSPGYCRGGCYSLALAFHGAALRRGRWAATPLNGLAVIGPGRTANNLPAAPGQELLVCTALASIGARV